ncbi:MULTISPECIES: hypothetical protein [unclassified Streptomyces]|uniref:hypothetical protein n=1 Tax=unclassified Streptomyces TaxID=2593676 RepID=UPI002E78C6B5|nr:hypothetical protein [Streptomyces sp. JV184]MEE1747469.1 hypothetical protein [Streptomyces sp. JV184]
MSIRTDARRAATTVAAAVVLGALLVGCSEEASQGHEARRAAASEAAGAAADPQAEVQTEASTSAGTGEAAFNRPEAVRDAFAGLQATLNEDCAPGSSDCAYFLGRVHDELLRLATSMKADAQGPGHFKEPIAWIATLRRTLKDDTSTDNLEKHRSELIGTRDRINTWMQGHPEDYR